jgi:hypothetical protein
MMIDDDTLKQLLRIDDELMRLCKWLNEKRDIEIRLALSRSWMTSRIFSWKQVRISCTENRRDQVGDFIADSTLIRREAPENEVSQ